MDTKQLKYFIAVCQSRSITNAAESIFISQQALSASIAKLEKELQTTLFVRSAKGVEPTKDGLYLLSEAKKNTGYRGRDNLISQSIPHDANQFKGRLFLWGGT